MKKILKISGLVLLILLLFMTAVIAYVTLALPNVGNAPELKVERTPERIARGEYLANHVTVCMDCHSTRDWSLFSGPIIAGTEGKGGEKFDQKLGFPGVFYSRNITPAGISRYTDGELFRVITTGETKEGRAMFPVMPYTYYGRMDPEDIKCIIAYIRTLPPIESDVPESVADFPMNIILHTIPQKAAFTKRPPESEQLKYGAYMLNASGCRECHTKADKGTLIAGTEFGGGREFTFPDGSIVRSANISPDKETGIGDWTEDFFIERFRSRSDSTTLHTKLPTGDVNSVMPWAMYGSMKENDLRAIYTYLQTLTPIKNTVVKYQEVN